MNWVVSQIGARQHYATARALHRHGSLDSFYTEAWADRLRPLWTTLGGRFKALADRYTAEIPREKVVGRTWTSLVEQATRRRRVGGGSLEAVYDEYIREGSRFARWVSGRLSRRDLRPDRHAFYGCQSSCLETLTAIRDLGLFTLVDQFDPARVEQDLVEQEREKWPGWEKSPGKIPERYFARCQAEWTAADVVMVYSEWTRQAIIGQGIPAEKVVVVPLAYEPPADLPPPVDKPSDRPLTVLWLGTVMLRKGIPYLIEAARKLVDRPIRFVVAGQVMISEQAVASAPKNVTFIGRVFRGDTPAVYRDADLFVLPTISDSFALTQVEAMAFGLPVIATPRCGTVVTDGVDGRVVPAGDAEALAAAIAAVDDDRAKLREMSAAARVKATQFSLDAYATSLSSLTVGRPDLVSHHWSSTRINPREI